MPLPPYGEILCAAPDSPISAAIDYLGRELKYKWVSEYEEQTAHPTEIVEVALESFSYVFDLYGQTQMTDCASEGEHNDGRLIAAYGMSKPPAYARETSRLRGWIGPTQEFLGTDRDKGHFIAHSIGGHVDRFEINLFAQARRVNRGWSEEGKIYRDMERYCAQNPGTFCFSRPFYANETCRPNRLEFGVLLPDRTLWVKQFEN